MHCKFWGFAYCFLFLFFSFFLSTCEFRFIERIGAHGKQNPCFIIIIILGSETCWCCREEEKQMLQKKKKKNCNRWQQPNT